MAQYEKNNLQTITFARCPVEVNGHSGSLDSLVKVGSLIAHHATSDNDRIQILRYWDASRSQEQDVRNATLQLSNYLELRNMSRITMQVKNDVLANAKKHLAHTLYDLRNLAEHVIVVHDSATRFAGLVPYREFSYNTRLFKLDRAIESTAQRDTRYALANAQLYI